MKKKIIAMTVEDQEPKNRDELSEDDTNEISDYEKLRLENIQERNNKMKILGLNNQFA